MTNYKLLRRVTLFEGLNDETLEQLYSCLSTTTYKKDSVIVEQDTQGDALYIIQSGRVKVVLTHENGREMILSIFEGGDFFGEMSLLDDEPRSASVIAIKQTEVLVLSRKDFVAHLGRSPHTSINTLGVMCQRLRQADHIIGNLALLDVYGRVARTLIDLAKKEGVEKDEGIVISQRPTQQELASMIGTSRETVSRVLSELQKRGLLMTQGKRIILSHGFAEETQGH